MIVAAALSTLLALDALGELRAASPYPGESLLPPGREAYSFRSMPDVGSAEWIESPEMPDGVGLRVTIKNPQSVSYAAEVVTPGFLQAVKKDDVVLVRYRARAVVGRRENGLASWSTWMQLNREPWSSIGSEGAAVGREWTTIYQFARSTRDYAPGELQLTLHVGQTAMVFDVGGFAGLNLGPKADILKLPVTQVQYAGREPNAAWRKKADAMIEANRKGPVTVVVRQNGKPVRGAQVAIRQIEHDYPFGSFGEDTLGKDTPEGIEFRRRFRALFNRATVPIYWADWGWESPDARANYERTMDWCEANGLRMKAHTLLWPSTGTSPAKSKELLGKPKELDAYLRENLIARTNAMRKRRFENVDVLNEIRTESEFANIVGRDLYKFAFDESKAAWPRAALVYNDYSIFEAGGYNDAIQKAWEKEVDGLIQLGAPVNMLGWQGHCGGVYTPPTRVWELLDKYHARWKLPFEITEFEVNTSDERLQADYLRDLLTAWFAHPATEGFTMWGFYEGTHWIPLGAMYRRDWSAKPSANVWIDLTRRKWWTNTSVPTDARGQAASRAFYGKHSLTVRWQGKTVSRDFTLTRDRASGRVVVDLPSP